MRQMVFKLRELFAELELKAWKQASICFIVQPINQLERGLVSTLQEQLSIVVLELEV
jgi:hypothetical protein